MLVSGDLHVSVSDLDVPAELADLVLGQPPAVQPPRPHAGSTDLGRRPLRLGPDNDNNSLVFPLELETKVHPKVRNHGEGPS